MRVAIISADPAQLRVDKPAWIAAGFTAAGHDVRRVHSMPGIADADAECDLLLFDQCSALPGCNINDLARLAKGRRNAVWAQWWRDLIEFEPNTPLHRQPAYDANATFWRGLDVLFVKELQLMLADEGIKAEYLDQACPADMPAVEHLERPLWDVLVVGSMSGCYRQRREDARALAAAGFRVLSVGFGGDLPPGVEATHWHHPINELPALVSQCGVVLGVDLAMPQGFTSDRSWLAGGMGACYVARVDVDSYGPEWGCGELEKVAPALCVASPSYETHGQLIDSVRFALSSAELRRTRGAAARARVMQEHTYRHRAEEIVRRVENLAKAVAA